MADRHLQQQLALRTMALEPGGGREPGPAGLLPVPQILRIEVQRGLQLQRSQSQPRALHVLRQNKEGFAVSRKNSVKEGRFQ